MCHSRHFCSLGLACARGPGGCSQLLLSFGSAEVAGLQGDTATKKLSCGPASLLVVLHLETAEHPAGARKRASLCKTRGRKHPDAEAAREEGGERNSCAHLGGRRQLWERAERARKQLTNANFVSFSSGLAEGVTSSCCEGRSLPGPSSPAPPCATAGREARGGNPLAPRSLPQPLQRGEGQGRIQPSQGCTPDFLTECLACP